MSKLKAYYYLAKPGIVYGNALAAAAGFLFASAKQHSFSLITFISMLVGTGLIIGCVCVFNNYIDRGIDGKMARTKKRASVSGIIKTKPLLIYGTILGLLGVVLLFFMTNLIVLLAAGFAGFAYIVLYSIAKRKTVHGTLVGTISGAMPPVIGYVAVTNSLDLGAVLLFIIMVCWQMPHFFAIAIRRKGDYESAGIPVMPLVRGVHETKVQMMLYILAYLAVNILLFAYGYVGYAYLIIMSIISLGWFGKGLQYYQSLDDEVWAKKMFLISLLVLLMWCTVLPIGALLP